MSDEKAKESTASAPGPEAVVFESGSPEYALVRFMEAWRERDWETMIKYSQATWVASVPCPEALLKGMFTYKPVLFVVKGSRHLSPIVYEADIETKFEIARGVNKRQEVKVRVLKEAGPMTPSENGTWGVNPPSAFVW